jgi:sugar phosphate permease
METDIQAQKKNNNLKAVYTAWGLVACFYLYQYMLRVSPGVMVNDLRGFYKITAEQFSLFGALTLYAYGLLQIPIGVLLDSVGVKKTVLVSLAACISGTMIMGTTDSLYLAYLSRFLIGAGSACAFITCLKIVGDNLPEGKRGLLMGSTLTMGTMGALLAGKPQSYLMSMIGWQKTLVMAGLLGLTILGLILMLMPKKDTFDHKSTQDNSFTVIKNNIKEIIKIRSVVIYAILAVGLYTPLSALADLWGVAFLMEKFGCARHDAAGAITYVYVGLCIGSFLVPWYFEAAKKLNLGIQLCCLGITIAFGSILYLPLGFGLIKAMLFSLGFFCGAEMMCFTGVAQDCPEGKVGTSLGFTNTMNMLGGAVLQQLIGTVIDYFWDGKLTETGLRYYSVQNYTTALSFLMGVIVFCLVLSLTLRPSKKNMAHENHMKSAA